MRTTEYDEIEVINPGRLGLPIRHALFDFDGTLSLLRQGWQEVMVPLMVEVLMETPCHEPPPELERFVRHVVTVTTGQQTIFQMMRLAEEVKKRGGNPEPPGVYKKEYLARLWERIKGRVEAVKSGKVPAEQMMVPGAVQMLEALKAHGVRCYLASGTDEVDVRDEARALGIIDYFDAIHGAQDDRLEDAKMVAIHAIFSEQHVQGTELVTFGDGYVEIEDTKRVGGLAVGVASDEVRRAGTDQRKRQVLIAAGADIIIPDFRAAQALTALLFGEE
ncbi:MAG: HAD family hydrolase [candidate division KSB1 bacterium]|nr:HAD family hydrolase [candidate division KSB1 bacterium]MDZ7378299.1 HAD family hydrolase [candidate division KSB1 bacterium]MDZ7386431.1 HAD family hydrolase [candidate division KSB1 bacterium]MDZ7392054.1 HAD family hydrolase [candidate division KSB1 bacterium]